ncbi:unnamed protein product [Rhizoctonia solani]|uniref:DUF605-domain-containing protein n=1 Tax=Rhizoctonia solani TaxID=456999 RepID=A0A8H3EC92_9AGAM|nr:unnamed protein product [Rhizoctonia solani]
MPLTQVPPELKPIAPFLQRADEMRTKDPIISFWCEYYAVKKGLSLKLGSSGRPFLANLMDSLEATKLALRSHESVTNEEVAYLYVENFADRIFVMADEEDRKGAASRSTAKKFLAAGQFFDLLSAFDNVKSPHGPKTVEKRTYAKWRATEISKAFRDGRTPPPPPSPVVAGDSQLPVSPNMADPSASLTLTAGSQISLLSTEVPSSSSPPPVVHTHSRTQSSQSATTSSLITSANGSGPGNGNGAGSTSRRRASDVSTTTPTRSAGGSSPLWSSRVQSPPDASGRDGNYPSIIETSPTREKRIRRGLSNLSSRATPGVDEEDSETDPGTDEDENGGHLRADGRRSKFNSGENGHEASGDNSVWSNGAWDNRQASLAVQPPESRQPSFAQRPIDPASPTAASPPGTNGPPTLIYGPPHTDSTPSSQSSSKQTSPRSGHPNVPGRQPSPATSTATSSHASTVSISTPISSPATKPDSPIPTMLTPTGAPTTALVLPPRRVHFSGSTVGGMSSVASSSPESSPEHTPISLPDQRAPLQITGPPSTSPTHSRRYEPTPRAPAALLPPPDMDSALPPLSGALVRPQSYQVNRAIPSIAYPTASAPPYPEPTYVSPPPLVHHSPSQSHSYSPSQTHALVHVPQQQQSSYPYAPATPQVKPSSPPLPTTISGQATQRAQKHAKFAISALDYDDLETARKELLNALAIVNGRASM